METGAIKEKEMVRTELLIKPTSKISGLCGDSEREKRPSPWVSQQLVEKQPFRRAELPARSPRLVGWREVPPDPHWESPPALLSLPNSRALFGVAFG